MVSFFSSSAESFNLGIPGKATSWINLICSTIWGEVDGTSSLTTEYQNLYIFWWDMFFQNTIKRSSRPEATSMLIYIHCFHMVHKLNSSSEYLFFFPIRLFYLSTSSFFNLNLSTSSLLINLISLSFEPWIFWQLPSCFRFSCYFLSFFGCCQCWFPCKRLSLHYEKFTENWNCYVYLNTCLNLYHVFRVLKTLKMTMLKITLIIFYSLDNTIKISWVLWKYFTSLQWEYLYILYSRYKISDYVCLIS